MSARQNHSRRGAMLVAVLVCLGVAMTIILASVKMSVLHRQQLRQDLQMEQTKWLLDAGVRAGIKKSKEESNFKGETLQVTPALSTSVGYPTATLEIIAEPVDEDQIRLRVTANLESDAKFKSTKRSATVLLNKAQAEQLK